MPNYNTLKIDLSAIKTNCALLQKKGRLMPMLKANAYGTSSIKLANFLQDCKVDIFGLSHISEAIELRKNGIEADLLVISSPDFDAPLIVEYDLQVTLSSFSLLRALEKEALKAKKKVKVHLDINTGMHRFGCKKQEALSLALAAQNSPCVVLEGIMTHFVGAESESFDSMTETQMLEFREILSSLQELGINPPWVHVANSAGALRFNFPECNMIRVGLALFGIYSSPEEKKTQKLIPALTLESKIVGITECNAGDTVGYLRHFIAKAPMKIGVLPIGYHDGLHLTYSGKGHVLIHGKKAPYIGRICMDFMMVDLTRIPEAKIGDSALIFGPDLPPEEVAGFSQTNVRELMVCLGPRVKREFTNLPASQEQLKEFIDKSIIQSSVEV